MSLPASTRPGVASDRIDRNHAQFALSLRLLGAATRFASGIAQTMFGARLTVLIFHRVLAQLDPLRPNTLDAVRFEQVMHLLRRSFQILPLDHALSRLGAGGLPPRAAAITFDDGYADNFTVAAPILDRLGLTATFFVATGFLDGGRMWNDTVTESIRLFKGDVLDLTAFRLGHYSVTSASERFTALSHLLGQLKYLETGRRDELTAAIAEQTRAPLPDGLMMTSAQVKSLAERGMTIGAHTVNHPILANVGEREAEDEIKNSKAMLDALLGIPVTLFAYPNGKPSTDYDRRHVDIVRRSGFSGAVSTAVGAAPAWADLYQVPRFTPWGGASWRYCARLVNNLHRTRYPVAL